MKKPVNGKRQPGGSRREDPAGTGGHQLALNLRGAYLSMHRATNACFAETGLSADSFTLLVTLADFGPMTQKELAEHISSDANTVSAMVSRLERLQLVERKRDKEDGRARKVHITAKGRRQQTRLWKKSHNLRMEMEKQYTPEEMDTFIQLLRRVSKAVDKPTD